MQLAEQIASLESLTGKPLGTFREQALRKLMRSQDREIACIAEDIVDSLGLDVHVYYHNEN